jgi:predicted PurR-regulated permease PerM
MDQNAVSARLIIKVVLVTAAVLAGLYLFWQIRSVIGLLAIAAFFALAVAPAVNWLDERRVPRPLAILAVYLGIGATIFGIGLVLVPPVVTGVENLSEDLPGYIDDLRNNGKLREYDDRYHITDKLQEQADQLPSKLDDAAGALQDVTVGVFSKFVQLFAILVIAYFLLMEGQGLLEFFYGQFSEHRAKRLKSIGKDISEAISGYVFGNFVISVLAGGVTYLTLSLLDIPFAVPLAFLFAFLDLIPLVGATIGGILVGIVVAFFDFPGDLIVWLIVFIGYQQIENYLIQPVVYGKAVQVHPLVVIVAILIGSSLLGILGALVAIPIAAAVQSVVLDWWSYRAEVKLATAVAREPKPPARRKAKAKAKPKPAKAKAKPRAKAKAA